MTVDLYGSGGPNLGLNGAAGEIYANERGSLHIDAGKAEQAQQYNRFGGRFQSLRNNTKIRNF